METYVIVIFAILVILIFVVSKNNRRFIIYSITGLKRIIDRNLYNQEKNINNLYNHLHKYITKNELEEYARSYALKDDLENYALKDNLENYALKDKVIIKDDLENYAVKDDLAKYALKDEFVSKKDFLTYTLNNQQINKNPSIESLGNVDIETEKYKILSKIVDGLLKDNTLSDVDRRQGTFPYNIKNTVNNTLPIEIIEKNKLDEIMNEKLDTILPPSKLYDVYQPNWFK